jgi:RHS repeat-associated protein
LPAQAQVFDDTMVQPPTLSAPEPASVAGAFAKTAFGPADLSRGTFNLPGPFVAPQERGQLLADIFPSYSPENGLTEWGMGWAASISITRFRALGDFDYETDEFSSPWGRVRQGSDGHYYPLGLRSAVRLTLDDEGWTAVLPDGRRFFFAAADSVTNDRGTYQWMLSRVTSPMGDRAELTYQRNHVDQPFLDRVAYGGRGELLQVAIELEYEDTPVYLPNYRAGKEQAVDRRVKAVVARVRPNGTGDFEERWRYRLEYETSTLGPAYYLTRVTRVFASGEAEPPVVYTYDYGDQHLAEATFEHVVGLDDYLARFGDVGLAPDRTSLLDLERDGVFELEHHYEHIQARQTDDGWAMEELPEAIGADPLCRRSPSLHNPPRTLARLMAHQEEPDVVVAWPIAAGGSTLLTICDRLGVQKHSETVPGGFYLSHPRSQFADLNRDQRPDFVHVYPMGFQVLVNESEGEEYSFRWTPPQRFAFAADTTAAWVHDFNGDGIVDLVVRYPGGIGVYFGLGDFQFTTVPYVFRARSLGGILIFLRESDLVQFADANRDGLTDLVVSRGKVTSLFMNTGTNVMEQVFVPGLMWMGTSAYTVMADLVGSGETEILLVSEGRAYSLPLSRPSTGLLRQADDGKGTVLTFAYKRAAPQAGIDSRPPVLATVTAASSGYDTVSYGYDYEDAVTHSEGRFLVGFEQVSRAAPLDTEEVTFHHDDDLSGIVLRTSQWDSTSSFRRVSTTNYEPRDYQSIPFWRPTDSAEGYQSEASSSLVQTEYLDYDRELCPTSVQTTSTHGTLTRTTFLAEPTELASALHCLPANQTMVGTHPDPSLDFEYAVELARNDIGQTTSVTAIGDDGRLVLQEAGYDSLHRLETVTKPGQGTTTLAYHPATGVLQSLTSPEGIVSSVEDQDSLTDAIKELLVNQGAGAEVTGYYRYDGMERLSSRWDDQGTASETTPLEDYAYQYATTTQPGLVQTAALLASNPSTASSTYRRSTKLFTAAGEEQGTAVRIPEGWALTGLTTRSRLLGETGQYHRAPLALDELSGLTHEDLANNTTLLSLDRVAGMGHGVSHWEQVQQGVERAVSGLRELTDGQLVQTSTENSLHETQTATDVQDHVLWAQDQAGHRTSYTYDALGRLVGVTLADSQQHMLRFDSYGRPQQISRDGVATVTYNYDPVTGLGSGKEIATPDGTVDRTIAWQRDDRGRVVLETHTLESTGELRAFHFDYDGIIPDIPVIPGQLGKMSRVWGEDNQGAVEFDRRLVFDPKGQLVFEKLALPGWRSVEKSTDYYENGEVRSSATVVRDAQGLELERIEQEHEYDQWGRLAALHLNGAELLRLTYDDEGRVERADFSGDAAGSAIAYLYDGTTKRPSGYWADALDWNGGVDWDFNNRGLIAQEDISINEQLWQREYFYEERGYLSSTADEEQTSGYSYSSTGLPDWISDLTGDRTLVRQGRLLTAGGEEYEYDELRRVTRIDDLDLTYGAAGEVDLAERGARQWRFVYDESGNRLAKYAGETGAGAQTPVAAYVVGGYLDENGLTLPLRLGGRVIGVVAGGSFEMLATDMRGTLLAEDGVANLATPYGVRERRPELSAALDYVEFGFDADLGVVRMGVRDYRPGLGQFLSFDWDYLESLDLCVESPVECNLYSYAGSNPLTYIDPTGFGKTRNRILAGIQIIGGAAEARLGAAAVVVPETATSVAGAALVIHGADQMAAGVTTLWTGEPTETYTHAGIRNVAQDMGATRETANQIATWTEFIGELVSGTYVARSLAMRFAAGRQDNFVVPRGRQISFESRGSGTHMVRTTTVDGQRIRINSGHSYNRAHRTGDVRTTGLSMDQVERGIVNHVIDFRQGGGGIPSVTGQGPRHLDKAVNIDGVEIGYRVNQLPDGTINVGTYWPQ